MAVVKSESFGHFVNTYSALAGTYVWRGGKAQHFPYSSDLGGERRDQRLSPAQWAEVKGEAGAAVTLQRINLVDPATTYEGSAKPVIGLIPVNIFVLIH